MDGQQEFINIPPADIPKVQELRLDIKKRYKDCIKDVLVAPESIDPRVVSFASRMNELNERRCQAYGQKYEQPEIFYIDAGKAALSKDELNEKLAQADLSNRPQILEKIDSAYSSFGNFIIVYVNCFDDPDLDAFNTATLLRHEMSHAGSIVKFRVYPEEGKSDPITQESYRLGGYIQSRKKGKLGVAFDEGHHRIEDEIFVGKRPHLKKTDPFLKELPDSDELFPQAAQNLQELEATAVKASHIDADENLSIYKLKEKPQILLAKTLHNEYGKLMAAIYEKDPKLYRLAVNTIYGDQLLPLAKKLEQHFGKGFFRRVMEVSSPEQAQRLLEQIGTP